ncbi:Phosphatidylinositol 4-phosphate 5-kinase 1 [Hondaea fermentalgiana]|uniref:Phosphatidylinositol 4-phosphate 5-kinase 1 n=1 Tax=Hondaea fermentalgiana TaxID=2315210 RepID=A0A2R5G823_9STRA|nr:Phosphatidylinositol 4-phosphate 5-kinase 1 [Hondaea fermentalgiana]|eukprot:GBG26469.1 Phosphatidylinositol 4-phosphate 5-kinase 1 [Hondaea fermentalgiana]
MSAPEINLQVDAFASNLVPEDFEAVIQDFEAKQAALNQACAKRSVRDVEINYTDNDAACRKRYVGAVRNGKPHGRGTLTWTCGGDYSGDFRNDKLTGFGIHTWKNGKRYVGQWLDGKACGYGLLFSSNGSMTYRGTWQDGLMHGFGRYNAENGDWYEGFWKLNNKDGLGVYQWVNGDRYEGEFANQQHHGRGIYMWPNGRKLTTTFVKHVPLHAWTLARFLWMCMTFFSVCYVAFHVLDMLVRSIDETLMHYDVPAWVTSFRHHFLGPAPYDLFTAVSTPHTASVHEEEKETDFLVQPEERMPTSDSFAANEVLDDSVPESSNSTWVYEMLRHELALPHIRIMLLLTLRPTLEEIFANIIANVACAWCHAQKLPISDNMSWHLGLALGCGSVFFFASLHILLYAFVM